MAQINIDGERSIMQAISPHRVHNLGDQCRIQPDHGEITLVMAHGQNWLVRATASEQVGARCNMRHVADEPM